MNDKNKLVKTLQDRITAAGKYSRALGYIVLLTSPLMGWLVSEWFSAPIELGILLTFLIGLYFYVLGRSIVNSNDFTRLKLIMIMVGTLILAQGIITLIVLFRAVVAFISVMELKRLDQDYLKNRVEKPKNPRDTDEEKVRLITLGYCSKNSIDFMPEGAIYGLSKKQLALYLKEGLRLEESQKKVLNKHAKSRRYRVLGPVEKIQELKKLEGLRDSGVITESELVAIKNELFGK